MEKQSEKKIKAQHTVLLIDKNISHIQSLCPKEESVDRIPHHKHSALQFELNTKPGIIKVVQLTLPLLKCIYLLLIIIKFLNFRVLGGNVEILLTH